MTPAVIAKAIVALILAVGTWAAAALTDGAVSPAEWGGLAGAVVTGLAVFAVPNAQAKQSLPPPLDDGHVHVDLIAVLTVAALVLVVLVIAGVLD